MIVVFPISNFHLTLWGGMQNRIVEISSDGAYLSVSRGFLSVKIDSEIVGKIAIDDMAALIIRGHGASLSVNICARLSKAISQFSARPCV